MKKLCGLVHTRACSYPILLIVLRVCALQKIALKKTRKFNLVNYTKTLSVRNRHNSLSHAFLHDTRANAHYFGKSRLRAASSAREEHVHAVRDARSKNPNSSVPAMTRRRSITRGEASLNPAPSKEALRLLAVWNASRPTAMRRPLRRRARHPLVRSPGRLSARRIAAAPSAAAQWWRAAPTRAGCRRDRSESSRATDRTAGPARRPRVPPPPA